LGRSSRVPEPKTQAPDPSVLERYHSEGGAFDKRPEHAPTPVPPRVAAAPAVLAPPARRRSQERQAKRTPAAKLVAIGSTPPLVMEQYRRLAATLHDLQVERGLKTLVVTSALPHDGKTITAANLALTLSESYDRRVLLIDADLRQPSLHKVLGVANGAGLGEAIHSPSKAPQLVEVSTKLTLLPGGQPDPNPLTTLSSEHLRALLEDFASRFDWVILDVPPVGLLPDGLILTRITGACIFVIRAGATPFAAAERAISELGRECIIGTVLNGVDEKAIPSTKYGEYSYAGH